MNYNCTVRPKTTCDNMLYFQDNQLDCSLLEDPHGTSWVDTCIFIPEFESGNAR